MRRGAMGLVVVLVSLGFTWPPSAALAAGPEDVFRSGETVVIRAGETIPHDLFLAGRVVLIQGTVQGDVMAAGQEVVVEGTIDGDLWAGAESVRVSGQVTGDVRVAANAVLVSGQVGRNVLAASSSLTLEQRARVGRDVMGFTGSTLIAGEVQGDASGSTSEYVRTGTVRGREMVEVTPDEEDTTPQQQPSSADWLLERGRDWLSLILVGGLLALIWRPGLQILGSILRRRPLITLGAGLLAVGGAAGGLFVSLILLLMLAVVLGSLGLGGLTAAVVLALLLADAVGLLAVVLAATLLAGTVGSYLVGRTLLAGRVHAGRYDGLLWLAVGALIYVLVGGIPFVGGVVQFLVGLMVLGTLVVLLWSTRPRPELAL